MKSYSQQKVNGFYKSHAANKGLMFLESSANLSSSLRLYFAALDAAGMSSVVSSTFASMTTAMAEAGQTPKRLVASAIELTTVDMCGLLDVSSALEMPSCRIDTKPTQEQPL